jgi:carboxymethylenebutenolidase
MTNSTITKTRLPVAGGELPLTIASGAGAGAAVVIFPAAFGVAPDLEQQMLELAHHATLVVSLDPFFRTDLGVVPYADMARVITRLGGANRDQLTSDFHAVPQWTRSESPQRKIVALGVCIGGLYALQSAAEGLVDGLVIWHGSKLDDAVPRAPLVQCPVRFHFGALDPIVPPATVASVRAAFQSHRDAKIFVHDGATHGFSHRTATAYHAPAEKAAMASVAELAKRELSA